MPIRLPPRAPTVTLAPGSTLWRVHRREHGPLWFGPHAAPRGRFDAPGGEFGTCYFGESVGVAVLETLVRGSRRLLVRADLEARAASRIITRDPLRLLRFEGPGLARLGIGAEQAHAAEYADCQRMVLDVWERHGDVDGVQYRSRWDTSALCWAVFDRAQGKLGAPEASEWLGDAAVLGPALDRYGLGVV